MRFLSIVFLYLGLTCVSACAAPTLTTIEVIDGYGNPVKGAKVVGRFNLGHRMSSGSTNRNGKTQLVGSLQSIARYEVTKTGYYDTNLTVGYTKSNTVTILLRKKRNPIAMYAMGFPFVRTLSAPYTDDLLGFDFFKGDFVLPGHKGVKPDIYFHADIERVPLEKRSVDAPFRNTLKISFPDNGNGIIKATLNSKWRYSELNMAYIAPIEGYQSTLETVNGSPESEGGGYIKKNIHDIFYLRIRTELNDKGEIINANYCKINDGISVGAGGRATKEAFNTVAFGFNYYCNPIPNDTNIEFDPSKNLFGATRFALNP